VAKKKESRAPCMGQLSQGTCRRISRGSNEENITIGNERERQEVIRQKSNKVREGSVGGDTSQGYRFNILTAKKRESYRRTR